MKNKNFFYQQYDTINWPNQEKTKINSQVNQFIIDNFLLQKPGSSIKLFDIGFGIGFFIRMVQASLADKFDSLLIEGCEPSTKNYEYFCSSQLVNESDDINVSNYPFLEVSTNQKFDFITAIYVFPHFLFDDLEDVAKKVYQMLEPGGQFIIVVANEAYIASKLKSMRDLYIETNKVIFQGEEYNEVLHYSDIPEIGKVIDYNRSSKLYIDLFSANGLSLVSQTDLNDNGFICTVFVFQKDE